MPTLHAELTGQGKTRVSSIYQNFDLTNGFNILRIICGAFLFPHLFAKATNFDFMLGVYKDFRLHPPKMWLFSSLTVEVICAPLLILGIYTRYVAIVVAIFLLVAAWSVWRQSKGKWLWNIGGYEYPVFWAICCFIVAMQAR
jgi:putative oxidoreductase